ncbi:MAG: NAD(P)/FAD-dependent oxidoreductase, partial [Rhodothermales bacterium]|nr:NAD(P)/FAD-dependent oxidoreductase [Rhodothermales bacterium]
LEREAGILGTFPSHHVDALAGRLRHEGVTIQTDVRISGVEAIHSGVRITTRDGVALEAERLLVAAGRVANTDGLGLESAGVKLDGDILDVDRSCRTRSGHVYGIGDVATRTRFTHTAGAMARTAVLRALFKVPGSFDERSMPAVVYTDPAIGCVGRREGTGGAAKVRQVHVSMDRVDRSLVTGAPTGEIRLRVSRWGRIRGADVLGANAGEIIGMISALIGTGAGIRRLSGTVLPYPTYSEGLGRAASKAIARSVPDRLVRLAARAAGLRGEHAGFDPDSIG